MSTTLQTPLPGPSISPLSEGGQRARFPAEATLFLLVWLLLIVTGRERLFRDPGTFWHTAVGEQILSSGRFTQIDSFTFTFNEQPWIAHQWLGECLMALTWRLGGFDAMLLVTCTLIAGLFAWIGGRWLQNGLHPAAAAMALVIVLGGSAHHFHVRPHVGSMVLLGATFALLCDVESGRSRVTRLWWLVPLFVLWANLHGAALAGLVTVSLVIAGWLGARVLSWSSPLASSRDLVTALAIPPVCAAAMFINPYGLETPRTWLTIMRLSLPDVIQEHGSPDFTHPETWFMLLLGIGYVAVLWRNGRVRVTSLLPLVWFCLACDRIRHAPLFAIVAAIALPELLPAARCRQWLIERGFLTPASPRPRWIALPAVVVSVAMILVTISPAWARLDAGLWPLELVPELAQLEQAGETRVFNALDYGGFLTFFTPRLRTFIDDRCELFGDGFLRDYARAELEQPQRIDDWRREYQFQHALVRSGSAFDQYLASRREWETLRRTECAVLYRYLPQ